MFKKELTRKLTLTAFHDLTQFGSGSRVLSYQSVLGSAISRSPGRQSMVRDFDVLYEHEFNPSINAAVEWNTARVWSNDQVRFERPDGSIQESFSANTIRAMLRFSIDERVTRNTFVKT